ncbi:MAG: hypothetical protein ACOCWQ_04310 [Nanoarchaeota archaeon]
MKPEKITKKGVRDLCETIAEEPEEAIGSYLYKGFRIQVSRYKISASERVLQLYHRRRKEGLCVQCGKKVKKINPRTGKPYRLCEYHRKKIDKK